MPSEPSADQRPSAWHAGADDGYRPDIDGLRAVAVLLVVVYHAWPEVAPAGLVGVDVFFVISGYLITGLLFRDLDGDRHSRRLFLLGFYARRFRRIAPALVAVLAATWALGCLLLRSPELAHLGRNLAASSWFGANVLLWKQTGYFEPMAEHNPLLHLWSLGVEEQYYLVWPVLLWWVARRRLDPRAVMLPLGAASLVLAVVRAPEHAVATFYLLPTRLWELVVGGVLASIGRTYGRARGGLAVARRLPTAAAPLAVVVLLATAFAWRRPTTLAGGWVLLPVLATAALVASPTAWLNRHILAARPLVQLGLVSYPLYLWHWPLLALLRITEEGEPSNALKLGAVAVATGLAFLTWAAIERPIRRLACRTRRQRWTIVLSSLGALTLLGVAGLVTSRARGFPGRYPAVEARARPIDVFDDAHAASFACTGPPAAVGGLGWCDTSRPEPPVFAVYGDSHAHHLYPGIVHGDPTTSWLLIGQSGCAPLNGVRSHLLGTREGCNDLNARATAALAGSNSIGTVVLASLGAYYVSDRGTAPELRRGRDASRWVLRSVSAPGPQTKAEAFEQGLRNTVSTLRAAGKDVVLFADTFELPFPPDDCLDVRPARISPSPKRVLCAVDRAEVLARRRPYRAILERVRASFPSVRLFDPLDVLCDQTLCHVRRDGVLYFRDGHHLSNQGSDAVAARFLTWLRAGPPDAPATPP